MIITTSASTVTTVTYLNLYDLENYKKQFQSFWIPFMEQFIPATTIWVAGERWCNDVCTIINPCDYDFELVDSEITIEQVPEGFFPSGLIGNLGFTNPVLSAETSTTGTPGSPIGTNPTSSPGLVPIEDLGLVKSRTVIRTVDEANIDITAYRSRFTQVEIKTEIVV